MTCRTMVAKHLTNIPVGDTLAVLSGSQAIRQDFPTVFRSCFVWNTGPPLSVSCGTCHLTTDHVELCRIYSYNDLIHRRKLFVRVSRDLQLIVCTLTTRRGLAGWGWGGGGASLQRQYMIIFVTNQHCDGLSDDERCLQASTIQFLIKT